MDIPVIDSDGAQDIKNDSESESNAITQAENILQEAIKSNDEAQIKEAEDAFVQSWKNYLDSLNEGVSKVGGTANIPDLDIVKSQYENNQEAIKEAVLAGLQDIQNGFQPKFDALLKMLDANPEMKMQMENGGAVMDYSKQMIESHLEIVNYELDKEIVDENTKDALKLLKYLGGAVGFLFIVSWWQNRNSGCFMTDSKGGSQKCNGDKDDGTCGCCGGSDASQKCSGQCCSCQCSDPNAKCGCKQQSFFQACGDLMGKLLNAGLSLGTAGLDFLNGLLKYLPYIAMGFVAILVLGVGYKIFSVFRGEGGGGKESVDLNIKQAPSSQSSSRRK